MALKKRKSVRVLVVLSVVGVLSAVALPIAAECWFYENSKGVVIGGEAGCGYTGPGCMECYIEI